MTSQTRISGPKLMILALVMVTIVVGAIPLSTPAAAQSTSTDDVVLEWNAHASSALMNAPGAPTPGAGLPPQVAILHIAMMQGAIYDAVNMIAGGYQPYLSDLPEADPSASQAAAVATAAHDVLVGVVIVPALSPAIVERLDMARDASIAEATSADGPEAVAAGIAAGEAAAAAMLAERADDGRFVPLTIQAGSEPGDWRPAPPSNTSDPNAWVGRVDPFLLESPSQFRSKGPQAVKSIIYTLEYYEVKLLGALDSHRNARQEAIAKFFVVNPVELFNRAFRTFATTEGLTTVEQARLFAMLNMAGADALINCFSDKEHFNFWRPVTAIHLGDSDGNRLTFGDSDWTPMVNTPPYSDHASGYNCVSGAFMHTAADFFGKGKVDFSLVRVVPGEADVTRTYKRFTDVIDDTIDARVYQGLHFRTADVQGAKIGKDVARWLDQHYFQPER